MHKCQLFCHNQGIYLNQYMKVQSINSFIFHNGGPCRIETSPLICSVNQWTGFCMIWTSVMKYSRRSSSTYNESLFLHVVKHDLLLFFCFFSIWVFFDKCSRFTGQQVKGNVIFLYPFYYIHLPHRHLDISWIIAA